MNRIDQVVKTMEEAQEMLEMMVGFKMNYKPQTLKSLEKYLQERKGWGSTIPEPVLAMFSVYLGQIIVKHIKGAEWVDDESFSKVHITIPANDGHFTIYPQNRIHKFLKDPTDGLYPFYTMIQDMSKGRLNKVGPSKDFIQTPRGYQFRQIAIPVELHERFKRGEITQAEMMSLAKKQQGIED